MTTEEKEQGNRVIVGTLDAMLTTGDPRTQTQRSFKVTGYLYSDDTSADVHARVDSYQSIIDRQMLKLDIQKKKDEKRQWVLSIENAKNAFNTLLEKRNSGKKISSQEKLNIDNHDVNVQTALKGIARLDEEIAALEKQVALT
jgi:hypothetical protein